MRISRFVILASIATYILGLDFTQSVILALVIDFTIGLGRYVVAAFKSAPVSKCSAAPSVDEMNKIEQIFKLKAGPVISSNPLIVEQDNTRYMPKN